MDSQESNTVEEKNEKINLQNLFVHFAEGQTSWEVVLEYQHKVWFTGEVLSVLFSEPIFDSINEDHFLTVISDCVSSFDSILEHYLLNIIESLARLLKRDISNIKNNLKVAACVTILVDLIDHLSGSDFVQTKLHLVANFPCVYQNTTNLTLITRIIKEQNNSILMDNVAALIRQVEQRVKLLNLTTSI